MGAAEKPLHAQALFCNPRSPLRSCSATSRSALRSRSIVFCHTRSLLRSTRYSACSATSRSAPAPSFSATPAYCSAPPDIRLAPLHSRSMVFCHARSLLRSTRYSACSAPCTRSVLHHYSAFRTRQHDSSKVLVSKIT